MHRQILASLVAVGLSMAGVPSSQAMPANGISVPMSVGSMAIPVQRRSQRVCRQDCHERCRPGTSGKKGCFSQCTRHCVHR